MSIDNDVFRAILALDSYNRGGDGLYITEDQIGNAVILSSSVARGITGFSFFAQAYNWNGETLISYRGTDNLLVDPVTGWFAGGGAYREWQAQMAADFYKSIINSANPYSANVEFTGHSLGGGLAGLMASLYGKQAVVFDNMPFQLAALGAYQASVQSPWVDVPASVVNALSPLIGLLDPLNAYDPSVLSRYYFGGASPSLPDWSQITGYAVSGEILASLRGFQTTPVSILETGQLMWPLGDLNPIDLHSQALLVVELYGEKQVSPTNTDWLAFRPYFVDRLFDAGIAAAIGATDANAMRSMIGYSAIDTGTRPFGDTGIRALYDDADDMGLVLKAADVSKTLKDSADAIGRIVVQFAGELANDKVMESSTLQPVTKGVVSVSEDSQTLAINFSDALWTIGTQATSTPANIIGRQDLTDQVFHTTENIFVPGVSNDIRSGMTWLWNDDSSSIVDRIVFATKDGPLATTLEDRTLAGSTKVSLFAAGGSDDTVTGSRDRDFIFGGDGNDTLRGGAGDDLLAGGQGDDRLEAGESGHDFLDGGDGQDVVFYNKTAASSLRLMLDKVANASTVGLSVAQLTTGFGDVDRRWDRAHRADRPSRLPRRDESGARSEAPTPCIPRTCGDTQDRTRWPNSRAAKCRCSFAFETCQIQVRSSGSIPKSFK